MLSIGRSSFRFENVLRALTLLVTSMKLVALRAMQDPVLMELRGPNDEDLPLKKMSPDGC